MFLNAVMRLTGSGGKKRTPLVLMPSPERGENFAWRSGVTASEAFGFFGRKIVTICSSG